MKTIVTVLYVFICRKTDRVVVPCDLWSCGEVQGSHGPENFNAAQILKKKDRNVITTAHNHLFFKTRYCYCSLCDNKTVIFNPNSTAYFKVNMISKWSLISLYMSVVLYFSRWNIVLCECVMCWTALTATLQHTLHIHSSINRNIVSILTLCLC